MMSLNLIWSCGNIPLTILIDNSPELDTSTRDNPGTFRPYWIDGTISYLRAKEDKEQPRLTAVGQCRFCGAVANRLGKLAANRKHTAESEPKRQSMHSEFSKSVENTEQIMERVVKKADSIPVVAFVTGTADSYHGPEHEDALGEICRRHNIFLLPNIENRVITAERSGAVTRAADQLHLNELGHRVLGETLAISLAQILPGI
jgi:hypothetical protein